VSPAVNLDDDLLSIHPYHAWPTAAHNNINGGGNQQLTAGCRFV
jgi:hypothetical protein